MIIVYFFVDFGDCFGVKSNNSVMIFTTYCFDYSFVYCMKIGLQKDRKGKEG